MLYHPVPKRIVRRPRPAGAGSGSGSAAGIAAEPLLRAKPLDAPPLLARLYESRSIFAPEDLGRSLNELPPPSLLKGMDAVTAELEAAIRGQKSIMIVADFDADGATSCAVAMRGLRALGAERVSFIVPNRFTCGYGLTPELVELIFRGSAKPPDVLLTVDTGIACHAGVAAAKARGMKVLVTDHHLPGESLPAADAIVNPNLPGDEFPGKALAGVGVIFYVLSGLRSRLRESGWFDGVRQPPNLAELLDLVALGTVADVVPLDRVNRILVHQGLQRIRAGRACSGIRALLEVADRNRGGAAPTAGTIGFTLGPRLNAAGRLDDMSLGIACLLAGDMTAAKELAELLDEMNRERKTIEAQMQAEAWAMLQIAAEPLPQPSDRWSGSAAIMFDPAWHQGVIGILASRIKDRLHRPVIAFARGEDGLLKGSARSIAGVHVRDVLCAVSARHPGIIVRFGGHAMAAGLTLEESRLAAFTEAFEAEVAGLLEGVDLEHAVVTDGELPPDDFHLDTARCLRDAGPWGQGFPEPLFDGEFDVLGMRIVGEKHLRLTLKVPGAARQVEGIAFFVADPPEWLGCRRLRAAYRLDVNEFRGVSSLQLGIEYMEPVS
ncbi:single-stranded-DNA-specific exonuclease RecJ [Methylococcus mesophilus]|uniref:single-stranded-DNA-specific exonuclease RecJ n=1 Tax=Methylococcus mesophilus TaxID=2993564 RepID=UPI00224A81B5|nr:single-stranded-DNA-specific exonuclease RecJ [Methylococcus mesophilus]UZR28319.1 single-stranded-DNA-specific exonuclease RecJ [Methylococcus mesophilus]